MNDSISRQAAIDALDGEITITGKTNAEAVRDYVNAVKGRIERISPTQPKTCAYWDSESNLCALHRPSAQPKQKKGHWKPFDLTWGRNIFACSACGNGCDVPTEMGKLIYEYCPFCGARMGEGEDDD